MFFTALLIFAVLNAVLTNPVPFEPREVDSAGCSPNSDMKELPYNNNNDDIDTNLIRRDPEACKSNPTFPESQPVAPDTSTQPQSAKTPCEGSLKPHYVTCGGFEIMDGWDVDIVTHCVMGSQPTISRQGVWPETTRTARYCCGLADMEASLTASHTSQLTYPNHASFREQAPEYEAQICAQLPPYVKRPRWAWTRFVLFMGNPVLNRFDLERLK